MAAPRKTKNTNGQHLISTIPTPAVCRKCGGRVLSCHVKGEPTNVDPVPINAVGEAACLITESSTYQASFGRNVTLSRRTRDMIERGLPAYGKIYPRHRCGIDWNQPEYRDDRKETESHDQGCPF